MNLLGHSEVVGRKMLATRRFVSIGTLLFIVARAGSALAEGEAPTVEDIKAAEVDFNRGREAYKQGSYTEAAEYFESADTHAPNERVLELAIGARDKAGALDRAATLAQLGIDRHPNSDRMKKVATPLIEKAKAELFTVVATCDEACNLLDGTRIVPGRPSVKRTLYLSPGDHSIRAVWSDDRGVTQNTAGKAGDSESLEFKAPPIPKKKVEPVGGAGPEQPGPGAKEEESHGMSPVVFFIGAGATAVLGGVTVWSGIDTINNPGKDKVQANCIDTNCGYYQAGRDRQLRTNILIGATGVVGAATAVVGLFLTDWGGHKEDVKADQAKGIRPFIGYSHGPTIGATGRF